MHYPKLLEDDVRTDSLDILLRAMSRAWLTFSGLGQTVEGTSKDQQARDDQNPEERPGVRVSTSIMMDQTSLCGGRARNVRVVAFLVRSVVGSAWGLLDADEDDSQDDQEDQERRVLRG